MNRVIVLALILPVLGVYSSEDTYTCETGDGVFPKTVCYDSACTTAIINHIEHEFNAAFSYMYMGALFGQYKAARPGITKFLLDSASEERGHAIQMLDYLNTRGLAYNETYNFANTLLWTPADTDDFAIDNAPTIENALKKAIEMEIEVTKKIREVVKTCNNDFHAADVFTNPILDEQHHGLRKLQGALKMLENMKLLGTSESRKVVDYFFDLKLLSGEV